MSPSSSKEKHVSFNSQRFVLNIQISMMAKKPQLIHVIYVPTTQTKVYIKIEKQQRMADRQSHLDRKKI